MRYALLITLVIIGALSYWGSSTGFGISIGLISAALGLALQKPILNIAAFVMIVTKRPFLLGDWIAIGDFQGEVKEISVTQTFLLETDDRPKSGSKSRIIILPNFMFLEQPIVNYTYAAGRE